MYMNNNGLSLFWDTYNRNVRVTGFVQTLRKERRQIFVAPDECADTIVICEFSPLGIMKNSICSEDHVTILGITTDPKLNQEKPLWIPPQHKTDTIVYLRNCTLFKKHAHTITILGGSHCQI